MKEKKTNIRIAFVTGTFTIIAAIIALAQPFTARLADSFFPTVTQIPARVGVPAGIIETVSYNQNFIQDGQEGLRIHIKFSTENMESIPCLVGVYFEYGSGKPVKDMNGIYSAVGGQVGAFEDFQSEAIFQSYPDFLVFIPYDEFHLTTGTYDLRFIIRLYDYSTRTFFAESEYFIFQHEQK